MSVLRFYGFTKWFEHTNISLSGEKTPLPFATALTTPFSFVHLPALSAKLSFVFNSK